MTAGPETTLRVDARRNRDQILAAAKAIFAVSGAEVPMEEIARGAGVGVGTLYRRFPDRDALIRAVATDSFERVLADAREAAATMEPFRALERLLHQSVELKLGVELAMVSERVLAILKDDPTIRRLRDEVLAVLDGLVRAAQAAGELRADVGTGDIAILFSALMRHAPTRSAEITSMAPGRCIGIMIDGLRARSGTALPGRPIATQDLGPLADH